MQENAILGLVTKNPGREFESILGVSPHAVLGIDLITCMDIISTAWMTTDY